MITSTQITHAEILAVHVFKLLSRKILFINSNVRYIILKLPCK